MVILIYFNYDNWFNQKITALSSNKNLYILKMNLINKNKQKKVKKNKSINILTIDFNSLIFDYDHKLIEVLNRTNEFDYANLNILDLKESNHVLSKFYANDKIELFLKKSFNLFDNEKTNEIDLNDLKTCVHNLGICPSESQFKEIISAFEKYIYKEKPKKKFRNNKQVKGDKVKYDDFESIIKPVLMSGKCLPKSNDLLRKAFQTISKNNKDKEKDWKSFEDMLCSNGDKFNFEEIENMKEHLNIKSSNDKGDQLRFNYSKYLSDLESTINLESFLLDLDIKNEQSILKSYGFEIF